MDLQSVRRNVEEFAQEIGRDWRARQRRTALDRQDFDALRAAGFHLTGVPRAFGGVWTDVTTATPAICDMLRALARADASLALVISMHPTVLGPWTAIETTPPEYQAAWDRQRRAVFESALAGTWWGTFVSEPGTGGDLMLSKAAAEPTGEPGRYRMSGTKHFASGAGMLGRMLTTALPPGEKHPDLFIVDMPEMPWDGAKGVRLIAPWDGHGMKATQSHAIELTHMPAERAAWPGRMMTLLASLRGSISAFFVAVTVGIVDAAMREAEAKLKPSRAKMKAYEQVEWMRAVQDAWLIEQAYRGMLDAMSNPARSGIESQIAKIAVAELAEGLMQRISRVIGGGAFSQSSPFGWWQQDVRALGYLRPPWAVAHEWALDAVTAKGDGGPRW